VRIYTKTGDDGTTGLLYGGRVAKDDLRVEAAGSADEAVGALGIARATCRTPGLGDLLLRLQRELFLAARDAVRQPVELEVADAVAGLFGRSAAAARQHLNARQQFGK